MSDHELALSIQVTSCICAIFHLRTIGWWSGRLNLYCRLIQTKSPRATLRDERSIEASWLQIWIGTSGFITSAFDNLSSICTVSSLICWDIRSNSTFNGFHANPTLYSGRSLLEEQKMIGSFYRGETIKKLISLFPHKAML